MAQITSVDSVSMYVGSVTNPVTNPVGGERGEGGGRDGEMKYWLYCMCLTNHPLAAVHSAIRRTGQLQVAAASHHPPTTTHTHTNKVALHNHHTLPLLSLTISSLYVS